MSFRSKVAVFGAATIIAAGSLPGIALASSHREAPLITKDPTADNTDLYAFVSPDAPDTVTMIANYIPDQDPAGGPNFIPFDEDALYWIKVDNNGDGVADMSFDFDFDKVVANPDSFLFSGYGPIEDATDPQGAPYAPSNVSMTYSVTMDDTELGTGLYVPPPNIGPRTTPDYGNYVDDGIHTLDNGVKVFAGKADDPFFVDLGSIFDLGGLRPFNQAHLIPLPTDKGIDRLAGINVNSIAIQVPIEMLTSDGQAVSAPDAENAVVGIYAGSSRRAMSVLSSDAAPALDGDWVQVSRLGNPLINEVVIPLGEKDQFNRTDPADDFTNFGARFLNSELAAVINTIYPSLPDARTENRTDLVLILGQGVPGLNATNTGDTAYDLLRLNMGIPPAAKPNRLGVIAGDLAGFPNGRRLWDDVVDIELRAIADGYGPFLEKNFDLPNLSPNNTIGDGCDANDVAFKSTFPYVANAHQGYKHGPHEPSCSAMPPSDSAGATTQRVLLLGR